MKFATFGIIASFVFALTLIYIYQENKALKAENKKIKVEQSEIISKAVADSLKSPTVDSLRQKVEIKSAELQAHMEKINVALKRAVEIQSRMERDNVYAERLIIERQRLLKQLNY